MTDAPTKRRCPNCAWAIKIAEKLQLSAGESWLFVMLAELVDGDSLQRHLTQTELSARTRMTRATIGRHVKRLVELDCIRVERTREGYHYELMRPLLDAQSRPKMPYDEPENVPTQEVRFSNIPIVAEPPGCTKIEHPDVRISNIPLMKTPLKTPLKEEPLTTFGVACASAPARETPSDDETNVVALPPKQEARQVLNAWNALAEQCDLPRVLHPGEAAQRKLAKLIRDRGMEVVLQAIAAVGKSSWCTGANDSGWRADFYFLLQPRSFERLLTGFYDDRQGRARVRAGSLAAFQQKYELPTYQPTFDPEPLDAERIAQ